MLHDILLELLENFSITRNGVEDALYWTWISPLKNVEDVRFIQSSISLSQI